MLRVHRTDSLLSHVLAKNVCNEVPKKFDNNQSVHKEINKSLNFGVVSHRQPTLYLMTIYWGKEQLVYSK